MGLNSSFEVHFIQLLDDISVTFQLFAHTETSIQQFVGSRKINHLCPTDPTFLHHVIFIVPDRPIRFFGKINFCDPSNQKIMA